MPKRSAGILIHRTTGGQLEVLLVHPGGPLWRNRKSGTWQIPKGEIEAGEDDEEAARREASEELGVVISAALVALGTVRQAGGKMVVAFAVEQNFDPATLVSNMVEIAWPARSGRTISIPEVDKACWFTLEDAREMMLASQVPFIDRLVER